VPEHYYQHLLGGGSACREEEEGLRQTVEGVRCGWENRLSGLYDK
jgi:hypothetical protein